MSLERAMDVTLNLATGRIHDESDLLFELGGGEKRRASRAQFCPNDVRQRGSAPQDPFDELGGGGKRGHGLGQPCRAEGPTLGQEPGDRLGDTVTKRMAGPKAEEPPGPLDVETTPRLSVRPGVVPADLPVEPDLAGD